MITEKEKINVLVTGAGSPGGPGIIRALDSTSKYNIVAVDANLEASGRFVAAQFRVIPKADYTNFIDEILEICKEFSIDIILPLVTKELHKFSQNKNKFKKIGITVIVPDNTSLKTLNDKGRLYQHLSKNKIKVPYYFLFQNTEKFIDKIEYFKDREEPIVVKPTDSNGSRGIRIIDNSKDLHNLLFNEKPNNLWMGTNQYISIIENKPIPKMMISEYLPGPEITVDTLVHKGRLLRLLIRTREQMRSGISISGSFIENSNVQKYVADIINTFPCLTGPIGFQLKKSSSDEFLIIECNPRLQGTSIASLGLDINLPSEVIECTLGNKIEQKKINYGVRFTRIYEEIFYR